MRTMRNFLSLSAVILFFVFFTGCASKSDNSTPTPTQPRDYFERTQLTDNIYLLDEDYEHTANIIVSAGTDGILLVDSGFSEVTDQLREELTDIMNVGVNFIVNTHHHGDHIGGNGVLAAGGTVIGHLSGLEHFQANGAQVTTFDDEYSLTFFFNKCLSIQSHPGMSHRCR